MRETDRLVYHVRSSILLPNLVRIQWSPVRPRHLIYVGDSKARELTVFVSERSHRDQSLSVPCPVTYLVWGKIVPYCR